MKFHHQRKQVSTCIILVLKEVKFLAFLALQRNYFMYVNQLVVPKTNQEINEPSYEMVGVKITVTNYGQYESYF
jgi:hypothetical protein